LIRFILLSTQRSGTTFIQHWLNSHPQISCHTELFLPSYEKPESFKSLCDRRILSRYFFKFYRMAPKLKLSRLFMAKLVKKFLEDFYGKEEKTSKAAGFRLMYGQLGTFPMLKEILLEQNTYVIHLIRKNKLKVHLSKITREKRGGEANSAMQCPAIQVTVDTQPLITIFERYRKLEERWGNVFAANRYLEITYEDFFDDNAAVTKKVEDFLGVIPGQWGWPKLKKLNPDSLKEIINNYDEVAGALQGTPFAHYLES
jgi:LPS sulfotransferase NodH